MSDEEIVKMGEDLMDLDSVTSKSDTQNIGSRSGYGKAEVAEMHAHATVVVGAHAEAGAALGLAVGGLGAGPGGALGTLVGGLVGCGPCHAIGIK